MSKGQARRTPKQERSERLRSDILLSASTLMDVNGYEAMTVTAVAAHANISIGAVYQYFQNKEAIGQALREQFGNEMARRWLTLESAETPWALDDLVDQIFDLMIAFVKEHPAYLSLLNAPIRYTKNASERMRLRKAFAKVFMLYSPRLSGKRAYLIADTVFEVVRGLNSLSRDRTDAELRDLSEEFRTLVKLYLSDRVLKHPG